MTAFTIYHTDKKERQDIAKTLDKRFEDIGTKKEDERRSKVRLTMSKSIKKSDL